MLPRAPALACLIGAAAFAFVAALAPGSGSVAAEPPASAANPPNPAHGGAAEPHAGTGAAAAPGVGTQPPGTPAARLQHVMTQGMTSMHTLPLSGDVDRDFATMMAAHHEHGVRMTEEYVRYAGDPRLRRWAEKTLAAQRKELAELRATGLVAKPVPDARR
jgi:hypothetical protein